MAALPQTVLRSTQGVHTGKLHRELNIIKYKVQFIQEVNAETIILRNQKKADILQVLVDKGYPQLSVRPDADDSLTSYDYLLKMDFYHLTREEIDILQKSTKANLWK